MSNLKPSGKDFGYMFAFVPMLFILFWGLTAHSETDDIIYCVFYIFGVYGIVALTYWILSYTSGRKPSAKKDKKGKKKKGGSPLDRI